MRNTSAGWLGLLALLLTLGCQGQPGDGAGAAIVGQPIGGDVMALPFARVSMDAVNLYAVSSPSGRYTIPGIPPGNYALRVAKWNTPLVTLPITVDPVKMPNIDLGRIASAEISTVTVSWPALGTGPFSLAGRAVDSTGRGIDDVEILLVYANGSLARAVTALGRGAPEFDGTFEFEALPDQPIRLIIGQEGFRPFVVEEPFKNLARIGDRFITGDVNLKSVLPAGADPASITVVVHDMDDRPLEGVTVHLSVTDPERPLIDRFGIGGVTDSDGRWTFTGVPGDVGYQLWAGNGVYFPATALLTPQPGDDPEVVLRLAPAGSAIHPALRK